MISLILNLIVILFTISKTSLILLFIQSFLNIDLFLHFISLEFLRKDLKYYVREIKTISRFSKYHKNKKSAVVIGYKSKNKEWINKSVLDPLDFTQAKLIPKEIVDINIIIKNLGMVSSPVNGDKFGTNLLYKGRYFPVDHDILEKLVCSEHNPVLFYLGDVCDRPLFSIIDSNTAENYILRKGDCEVIDLSGRKEIIYRSFTKPKRPLENVSLAILAIITTIDSGGTLNSIFAMITIILYVYHFYIYMLYEFISTSLCEFVKKLLSLFAKESSMEMCRYLKIFSDRFDICDKDKGFVYKTNKSREDRVVILDEYYGPLDNVEIVGYQDIGSYFPILSKIVDDCEGYDTGGIYTVEEIKYGGNSGHKISLNNKNNKNFFCVSKPHGHIGSVVSALNRLGLIKKGISIEDGKIHITGNSGRSRYGSHFYIVKDGLTVSGPISDGLISMMSVGKIKLKYGIDEVSEFFAYLDRFYEKQEQHSFDIECGMISDILSMMVRTNASRNKHIKNSAWKRICSTFKSILLKSPGNIVKLFNCSVREGEYEKPCDSEINLIKSKLVISNKPLKVKTAVVQKKSKKQVEQTVQMVSKNITVKGTSAQDIKGVEEFPSIKQGLKYQRGMTFPKLNLVKVKIMECKEDEGSASESDKDDFSAENLRLNFKQAVLNVNNYFSGKAIADIDEDKTIKAKLSTKNKILKFQKATETGIGVGKIDLPQIVVDMAARNVGLNQLGALDYCLGRKIRFDENSWEEIPEKRLKGIVKEISSKKLKDSKNELQPRSKVVISPISSARDNERWINLYTLLILNDSGDSDTYKKIEEDSEMSGGLRDCLIEEIRTFAGNIANTSNNKINKILNRDAKSKKKGKKKNDKGLDKSKRNVSTILDTVKNGFSRKETTDVLETLKELVEDVKTKKNFIRDTKITKIVKDFKSIFDVKNSKFLRRAVISSCNKMIAINKLKHQYTQNIEDCINYINYYI